MFRFEADEKQQLEDIPIASVRIEMNADDEKLLIRREAALDDPQIRFDLWDEIDAIIRRAEEILEPSGQDRMGVMITGENQDGTEIRIGISYRQWIHINADVVLHNIEQKLNSAETLYMNLVFTFSVRYMDNEFALGKKISWNGDFTWYTQNKRCIVRIHPENDPFKDSNNCLWQFLLLGYSYLVFKNEIVSTCDFINNSTYKELTKSESKFRKRQLYASRLKELFENVCSLETVLDAFESKFNVQIVLYSLLSFLKVEYPKQHLLPLQNVKNTIFGFVTTQNHETWQHVDLITQVTALSTKKSECSRICYYCFTIYSRSRNCANSECQQNSSKRCLYCHTCAGVCTSCLQLDCFEQSSFASLRCNTCNMKLHSNNCASIHKDICSIVKSKICICGRNEHRGLKCNEYICMLCGNKETYENKENHACFLKKQKMKKFSDKYWTYDFETCLNANNEHILYLATATCLYWQDNYEELRNKYKYKEVNSYVVFLFWGLENVFQFFDFVCEPCLSKSTFYAHNAGKYDAIFIEKYMFELKKLHTSKIQQGLRIMQLYYNQIEITFRDSLFFIPTSLRSMSTDFGIRELKKGFFPHKLVTECFLQEASKSNFIVCTPDKSYFEEDLSFYNFEKEKEELNIFLQKFSENKFWDMKSDAIDYCISDTILLAEVLKTFREKTFEITSKEFDVLNYITLPSAVMKYYLSTFLPEKTISIIDRYSSLMQREAMLWILWILRKEVIVTKNINSIIYNIRVSYVNCNKVYLFYSCYDNGCKMCYHGASRNFRCSKTFNECFLQAQHNIVHLKNQGYEVIFVWEHDWYKTKETKEFLEWEKQNYEIIEEILPLDPREAYKGGVSELYKFSVEKNIQMVDFVSQYPTSLLGKSFSPYTNEQLQWFLPTGVPKRKKIEDYVMCNKLAIVKCKILPPKDLYAPFLGFKVPSILSGTYEVLYGLCKTCMIYRNLHACTHIDDDRAIFGTWTSVEIHHALKLGYKICKMIDVWEYETQSNTLFTDFITPFMITKIISKRDGIVHENSFTTKGKLICQYVQEICGKNLHENDFQNKPAERMIAKLMMNSFYGKWGQRSNWPETSIFSKKDTAKCLKILSNPIYEILHGEVINKFNESFVVLEYEKKIATVKGDANKNDHIAAFVTAYGRIMLNELLQKLGDDIIYSDTDSAFCIKKENLPFQTGFRIGDLELELENGYNWSALGRKSYSFETAQKVICKQKGISLRNSMRMKFTPSYLRHLFWETYDNYVQLQIKYKEESQENICKKLKKMVEDGLFEVITVQQRKFQSLRENRLTMKKQTILQEKKTAFLLWGLKRVPLWENRDKTIIDSLPFGYCK